MIAIRKTLVIACAASLLSLGTAFAQTDPATPATPTTPGGGAGAGDTAGAMSNPSTKAPMKMHKKKQMSKKKMMKKETPM